jgi:hypothetical protein
MMEEIHSYVEHVINDQFYLRHITIRDQEINDLLAKVKDWLVRYQESREREK